MNNYRFRWTILVPTHQRANLLKATLQGLLAQSHDSYEIVVSNNYSRDNTREVLASFAAEPKIKVVHTDRKMSMPAHWEFAMGHVSGEHILILGDDDGVRPDCLRILDHVMAQTGANLLKFKTGLYYHPDWVDDKRNTLEFDSRCSNDYFTVDKQQVIADFCDFKTYRFFPNLLQSSFSFDLYQKAKERCGTVFVGAPDWTCPFVVLMQDSARLAYIDSTLGYGGRSQMSNAAYYENNDNEHSNERLTQFINELSAEVRFPYHVPQITVAGNFTPASFSFAKQFYPEELARYQLNRYELSKVIQQDMAEEAVSNRQTFYTPAELKSFGDFIASLEPAERQAIERMPGYPSLRGRVLLQLKRVMAVVRKRWPALHGMLRPAANLEVQSRYPWDARVQLSAQGIHDASELMHRFTAVVSDSDRRGATQNQSLLNERELTKAGELTLPL